ncbi:HD-GYP domain-containing protein [Butyrivibrio sp.]|uniref:HD-GYP domain-containing protein n=1 Tax=Butyrivibrio sp. TaxID=28121 RepID=UPI0025BA02CB|nr:HD domain-containing phosphohydrolase [Butyrivibrio sp.]MBQ9304460.1 HD domain-containing protein [Butyrivibrio sp.]
MKLISVNKLEPGMVVSENIYTIDDRLVLPKGTVLDSKGIERIKSHSLYNIFIEDEVKPVPKSVPIKPIAELSYSEKLKNSEGFIRFKQHLEENAEKLEESFRMIANDTMPLDVDKLTEPVYHLFVEAGGTAGVFDMLHNLRDNSDAVYMHSLNVSLICNTLATWMRLPKEKIHLATAGGLLHDIGKVLLPAELLTKTTPLTPFEQKTMNEHVIKGYELVKDKDIDVHIKNCVLMHHELRDGSGFPFHLKNEQIDEIASIVTVANVYDEMTSQRLYRSQICPFEVIEQFEEEGIDKYDPNTIMTFLSNIVNTFIANRVMLNNGKTGDIIFVNPNHLARPVVKCGDTYVDLATNKQLSIVAVI